VADQALKRLEKIDHIVVLMMENRSFDQVLGYLMRDGMPEVRGLTGHELNLGPGGGRHEVHEYGPDQTVFPDKNLDPCHSKDCVAHQLEDGNGGFVKNFVATRTRPITDEQHGLVMGYYTSRHLPVYDHLARLYCVCDAWHSSVPGDTWPNRLFSISGGEGPRVIDGFVADLAKRLGPLKALANLPIYDRAAFTQHLEDRQWRWYSHDPATLRAVDSTYRNPLDLKPSNFAYFNRKKVSFGTQLAERAIVGHDSFLDDAAKGQLRDVSWIDPNFIDLSVFDPGSNDDHPPSDVKAGQSLVLELYEALRRSPAWEKTLLVITYDEHGGFYDHVEPPAVQDDTGYRTLGVRVPAILVGPHVKRFVCHETFDHTSLIKTILTRFAADPDGAAEDMGQRVAAAPHLGAVLQDAPRTDLDDPIDPHDAIAAWRHEARSERRASPSGGPSPAHDGAGRDLELHDFQEEFASFAMAMREGLLPAAHP
jgi:phospholipase C